MKVNVMFKSMVLAIYKPKSASGFILILLFDVYIQLCHLQWRKRVCLGDFLVWPFHARR